MGVHESVGGMCIPHKRCSSMGDECVLHVQEYEQGGHEVCECGTWGMNV